jgi:hypothetical protein
MFLVDSSWKDLSEATLKPSSEYNWPIDGIAVFQHQNAQMQQSILSQY